MTDVSEGRDATDTRADKSLPAPKRAFLVLGPESCGNHLTTRLLISAGCFGDGVAGVQRLDGGEPQKAGVSPIVWMRSVPHARNWPNIGEMVQELRDKEYIVKAVVPTRDWSCVIPSQVKAGHCKSKKESYKNLQRAFTHIFTALGEHRVPFVVLSYESLVQRPYQAAERMLAMLGLSPPESLEEIIDANKKWFKANDADYEDTFSGSG